MKIKKYFVEKHLHKNVMLLQKNMNPLNFPGAQFQWKIPVLHKNESYIITVFTPLLPDIIQLTAG